MRVSMSERSMVWLWVLSTLFVMLVLADVLLTLGYMPYEANPYVLRLTPLLWVGIRMGVLVSCLAVGVVLFTFVPRCGLYFFGILNTVMGAIVLNNVIVLLHHGTAF